MAADLFFCLFDVFMLYAVEALVKPTKLRERARLLIVAAAFGVLNTPPPLGAASIIFFFECRRCRRRRRLAFQRASAIFERDKRDARRRRRSANRTAVETRQQMCVLIESDVNVACRKELRAQQ